MFDSTKIQQAIDALKKEREQREHALEQAAIAKDKIEHLQELSNIKQL